MKSCHCMSHKKFFHRVLLTGATSGLGKVLVPKLLKLSKELVITGSNEKKLQELQSRYTDIKTLCCDLSEDLATLKQWIKLHPIDCLINNAGYTFYEEAREFSKRHSTIFKVNAIAPIELSVTAIQSMLEHQIQGTIVQVTSIAALFPMHQMSWYPWSKKVLIDFGIETQKRCPQIKTLIFCPGPFKTSFAKKAAQKKQIPTPMWQMNTEQVAEALIDQMILKKPFVIYDWKWKIVYYLSKLGFKGFFAKKADQRLR